ncbi:MAG: hypothetical protein K2O18_20010 [Oscillospiraceae bacterium]|nr:hypothetical protein [Oscillospiraceae bacterium]
MTKIDYMNPNGIWIVSTEGDDEALTMRSLGMYSGRIDEIAFALADKASYALHFKKVDLSIPAPPPAKARTYISIVLDNESGIQHLSPEGRAKFVRKMLKDASNIEVRECQIYGAVGLRREDPRDAVRKAALAKLTDEEKSALGLN